MNTSELPAAYAVARLRLALLLAVFAVSGCSPDRSAPLPTPPGPTIPSTPAPTVQQSATAAGPCGEVISVSQPKGPDNESLAIASSMAGVSLFDTKNGSITAFPLPISPEANGPIFRTSRLVSFVERREPADETHTFGQDSVYELDVDSSTATELVRLPNGILGYDWSPDGTLLAYQVRPEEAGDVRPVILCLFSTATAKSVPLMTLGLPFLTGTGQREETSVSWSRTGRSILVVDTAEPGSVAVVDLTGRLVSSPKEGTFARWLDEGTVLYQANPEDTTKPWKWFDLSLLTDRVRSVGLPDRAFRPSVSPDSSLVAFDDGDATAPAIYVFDTTNGSVRRLVRGYVAPVWLGSSLIAATAAGPCPLGTVCPMEWSVGDHAIGLEVPSGRLRQLALPTTLQGSPRYGAIDVWLPSQIGSAIPQ